MKSLNSNQLTGATVKFRALVRNKKTGKMEYRFCMATVTNVFFVIYKSGEGIVMLSVKDVSCAIGYDAKNVIEISFSECTFKM